MSERRWTGLLAAALLATAGCVASGSGVVGGRKEVDVEAERRAVMDADRAFDEATAASGADGWVSWFSPDATMFPQQGMAVGHDAIRQAISPLFADPNRRLRWEPTSAVVSAAGDLAYTIGRWKLTGNGEGAGAGEEKILGRGNYVTIWRKDAAGAWKVAVDIGNGDPPPDQGAPTPP